MSMRAALCAAAVAAGLVFSGCSAQQIEPEVARELQSEVQGIAVLTARGDTADAVAAAHGLATRVRTAQVEGRITGERAVVILQRVEQLIERLVRSGAGPAASDLPQPLAGPPSAPPADKPEEPPADPTEEPEEPDPEKDTEPDPEESDADETEELPAPEPTPVADAPLPDAPLLDTVPTDSGSSGSGTSGNSGNPGGGTGTGQQVPILPVPAVGNDAANNDDNDGDDDGGKGRGRGRGGDD